jgi:hypothetical protein
MFDPLLTSNSTLTLIALHLEDEALACSVILPFAFRAGAAIHILYATDARASGWHLLLAAEFSCSVAIYGKDHDIRLYRVEVLPAP